MDVTTQNCYVGIWHIYTSNVHLSTFFFAVTTKLHSDFVSLSAEN